MTSSIDAGALPAPRPEARLRDALSAHWPLIAGMLVMAVPTIMRLGTQTWSTEIGAHGPIILATGIWLLVHNGFVARRGASSALVWILPVLPAWGIYVFGRAYDFISLEALGLYLTFLVAAVIVGGVDQVRRNLFPLAYLGFIVPPPGWVIDSLTAPLRTFVSFASVGILQPLGYPITREGVTMTIAQYQLLVEDACAGMNSLIGLTAISLFYIYIMHRASWRYALLLVLMIVPIAIAVNIMRVIGLVLITYYLGDAAAQGFLHVTTGLVLFVVAILLTFAVDMALQRLLSRKRKGAIA